LPLPSLFFLVFVECAINKYIIIHRKINQTKHTAKELAEKERNATVNRGGGKEGKEDRKGGAAGHSRYKCNLCFVEIPSLKLCETHFVAKHPKDVFDASKFTDKHALAGGITTKGVAVMGSKKR
jgi:hypothetical protein